jgi:hypothetical protein
MLVASMNKTTNLLTIATITALLLMGTSVIPMQSYASGSDQHQKHKDTKDLKSSISEKTQIDKKSASQHQDQDNFCYRGDDCEQANQGQQIVGKDNDAKGFNDQSDNLAVPLATSTTNPSTNTTTTSTPATPQPTSSNVTINNIFEGADICSLFQSKNDTGTGNTQTATLTCTVTITGNGNSVLSPASVIPGSSITLNPSGGECPPPSVNGIVTVGTVRLDVCVTL